MIDCICPIPNRLPLGTVLHGSTVIGQNNTTRLTVSGRSIRIVPLTFYKVFSHWGKYRYEHVFATDEPFDIIHLLSYWDATCNDHFTDKMGSLLIPISVSKYGDSFARTFLFSKSINYLFHIYKTTVPLSLCPSLTTLLSDRYFVSDVSLEVPTFGQNLIVSGGVNSYGDFQKFMFSDVLYSRMGSLGLTPYQMMLLTTMTPELPERINTCLDEIASNYCSKEQIYNFIDDMTAYERGTHLEHGELFEDYIYDEFPPDPITTECLRSPTYILLNTLRPHLGDKLTMLSYAKLGYSVQHDAFTQAIQTISFSDSVQVVNRYDLIESIINIPITDYRIDMTWDSCDIVEYPYFNTKQTILPGKYYLEHIHQLCRQLFLNKWASNVWYDKVTISKNWLDELFICCQVDNKILTYYVNLAWFHLISPSLVNSTMFFNP